MATFGFVATKFVRENSTIVRWHNLNNDMNDASSMKDDEAGDQAFAINADDEEESMLAGDGGMGVAVKGVHLSRPEDVEAAEV